MFSIWSAFNSRILYILLYCVSIPGTMKTYWLEKREKRSVMTKGITIQEPHQWHTRSFKKRISTVGAIGLINPGIFDKSTSRDVPSRRGSSKMTSPTPPGSSGFFSEERRIYSPITFHDVARRSVANSPTKNMEIRGRKPVLSAIFNINGFPLFIVINIFSSQSVGQILWMRWASRTSPICSVLFWATRRSTFGSTGTACRRVQKIDRSACKWNRKWRSMPSRPRLRKVPRTSQTRRWTRRERITWIWQLVTTANARRSAAISAIPSCWCNKTSAVRDLPCRRVAKCVIRGTVALFSRAETRGR